MDRFMRRAFALAKKSDPFPNPKAGAVLVKGGKIIGEGWHRAAGRPHAEIEAIADAEKKAGRGAAKGATLYVTLEPCSHTAKRTPPCTKAITAHGISRVIYAMGDPNPLVSGAKAIKDAQVEVEGPADERAAMALNRRYVANLKRKPFVAIKMAMSADGKTATRTGDSKWISCGESRRRVHRMRAEFDAAMVGAGTVRKDDPELTSHGRGRDPYRVIVDGRLSIPRSAKVLRMRDGKTIIAASDGAPKAKEKKIRNALVLRCGKGRVDMRLLVQALSAMGVKRILIEGGAELNAEALGAGIVDEVYLFVAPKVVGGGGAKGVVGGEGAAKIADALPLKLKKTEKSGNDLLMTYRVIR